MRPVSLLLVLAANHQLLFTVAEVYNHWTGTMDWNGGIEWSNCKFSKNEVKRPHFLMHEDDNSDLMASLAYKPQWLVELASFLSNGTSIKF